jgi:hypothetical protein
LVGLGSVVAAAVAGVGASLPGGPEIRVEKDRLVFRLRGELVAAYATGADVAKPYFWPVTFDGAALTRVWPLEKGRPGESTDHVHQKSAWFCHGDVIPEGLPPAERVKGVEGVDFWSEGKGRGVIRCTAVEVPREAADYATVLTRNDWLAPGGVKVLAELRQVSVHDLGAAHLLAVEIDLATDVVPVTFGDTKEGSFAVRVNDLIRELGGNGRIENADGRTGEGACWGRASAWCDYSGEIGGKKVGIALLDDPANPYPACWHVRAYGLMAANPFGRAKSGFPATAGRTDRVKLARGQHLKLRYGLLLHPGNASDGKVAEHYARFVRLGMPRR